MIQQLFLLVLYSQFLGVSFMDLDPFFPDGIRIFGQSGSKLRKKSVPDPDKWTRIRTNAILRFQQPGSRTATLSYFLKNANQVWFTLPLNDCCAICASKSTPVLTLLPFPFKFTLIFIFTSVKKDILIPGLSGELMLLDFTVIFTYNYILSLYTRLLTNLVSCYAKSFHCFLFLFQVVRMSSVVAG